MQRNRNPQLAVAAICFALLFVLLGVAIVADAGVEPEDAQVVELVEDPEQFRDWVDESAVPTAPNIYVQRGDTCSGGPCVKYHPAPDLWVLHWPKADFGWTRGTFFHELGHVFQLAHNDEVQNGYPPLDSRCGGVYSFGCAEYFADRYRDCAKGVNEHPPTCAFIREVAADD